MIQDVGLPLQRDHLLHAIEKDLLQDEHVLAVFYGGSVGNQLTDLYSDIDLRVVVNEEVFEAFRLDKKRRARIRAMFIVKHDLTTKV